MNEEEYEIYKNETYNQADELLESKNFVSFDEKKDVNSLEKLLIEITKDYCAGHLTLGLFSTICTEFEGSENFHNFSEKAKNIGIKEVVFDRGNRLYHGKIKALADAARTNLIF